MGDKKCNEIIENLFLTGRTVAKNPEYILKLKITHVLNVAEELDHSKLYEHLKIVYKHVSIKDEDSFQYLNYFDEVGDFIHESLSNQGRVLVYCAAGASRSPTAIMAYLIKYQGHSMDEAFKLVKRKREVVDPNNGFLEQLKEYESKIRKLIGKSEEIKEEFNKTLIFRCKICRQEIFKERSIVHGMKKSCTSYFLDKPSWIEDDYSFKDDKIYCINKKCQQKLGEMKISGNKCSCGEWFAPSFQIHKNKIDMTS